jgi:hypothetical protein
MIGPLCRYAAPPIAHHRTYGSDLAWVCTRIRNLSLGGPVPAEALCLLGDRVMIGSRAAPPLPAA